MTGRVELPSLKPSSGRQLGKRSDTQLGKQACTNWVSVRDTKSLLKALLKSLRLRRLCFAWKSNGASRWNTMPTDRLQAGAPAIQRPTTGDGGRGISLFFGSPGRQQHPGVDQGPTTLAGASRVTPSTRNFRMEERNV